MESDHPSGQVSPQAMGRSVARTHSGVQLCHVAQSGDGETNGQLGHGLAIGSTGPAHSYTETVEKIGIEIVDPDTHTGHDLEFRQMFQHAFGQRIEP